MILDVAKASKAMLNKSGESEDPCLVPNLRGNAFSFPPLRIYFHIENVGWSYMDFIMLRYFYSVNTFEDFLS